MCIHPRPLALLALLAFLAVLVLSRSPAQDPAVDPAALARELPCIPPRSPEEALGTFRIEPGFRIDLVAAEPDVVNPVAMGFDEEGRMLVVEMRDYPFEPGKGQSPEQDARAKPGRVRLLEDTDGDGRVDRSVVFADGLPWPTGIHCWGGGAFVTAAPDILYLKDEDGDGSADRREVVFTGFGKQNVQALLNSLRWGLDNRIHGASGGNGGDIRGPTGDVVSLRGRDFRFRPGANPGGCGPLEPTTGGGQFGMCFDDWGDRFVCNNSNHLRHVVLEARCLDRNPYLAAPGLVADVAGDGPAAPVFRSSAPEPWRLVRTRWRAASAERSRYAPTELVPIGFFTSATGVFVYRGDAFPPEYRGNVFVGDVGGNLVHRKVLDARGVSFTARRPPAEASSEFLTSNDNWFRPVSFAEGPDGCLYVLDMYRETIEHPLSIPDSIKRHLDLKSGDDRGRIYRIAPMGFVGSARPRLARAPTPDLVARLDAPAAWWRETAHRVLIERHGHGGPGADPAARGEAVDLLRALARGGSRPVARVHALSVLDGLAALEVRDLEMALADGDGRVREAGARLAEAFLRGATDPAFLQHLSRLAADPDVRVRKQVALTLGAADGTPEALDALVKVARRDCRDAWMRLAVLASSATRSGAILTALLAEPARDDPANLEPLLERLAAVAGARGDPTELAKVLEAAARSWAESREGMALSVLGGLGEGLRQGGKSLATSLPALLVAGGKDLERAATALEQVFSAAAARAGDGKRREPERLASIRLLASARFELAAAALEDLLDAREPPVVQLAAIRSLAAFAGEGVGPLIVSRWRKFSLSVRREAVEALLARRERLPALLAGLEEGMVAAIDLDPSPRQALLANADPAIARRAQAVLGQEGSRDRAAIVEKYRSALALGGDLERGKQLFRRHCATCHRLGGEGHAVAPDFNTVRDRSSESLLIHILDPNREVAPPYVAYTLVTGDGRVLTGIVSSETDSSVTLRRAEGVEETVLRARIARLESSGASLMPEGLEKDLGAQDLADIMATIRRVD